MSPRGKVIIVCLLLAVAGAFIWQWRGATAHAAAALTVWPDEDALQRAAGFPSLAEALAAARQQNNAASELAAASLIAQQRKLTAADGAALDQFGVAVALSGDTAVIGAPNADGAAGNQGAAYVFVRSGNGWSPQQKLFANDGAAGDNFGVAVAISGDTAVVGAFNDDVDDKGNQGSAYVFMRNGTVWTQQAKLTADDGAPSDQFGFAVAVNGDTVVVGAGNANIGAHADQGAAYVFTRSGTVWTQQQKLFANDGGSDDFFGGSVALGGDTVVVGAFRNDNGATPDQGAAYVFARNGALWTLQQKLLAEAGAANDFFGVSVALSGDTVVVGAIGDDLPTTMNVDQGAAYVFTREGTSWKEQQMLSASDAAPGDDFGFSVAVSGDTLVVGALFDTVSAHPEQGAAYVFGRRGVIWRQQHKLFAEDGAADDQLGRAVAVSGDTVLVGADGVDSSALTDQGAAYVFVTCANDFAQRQQLTANNGAAGDQFGRAVALDGDTAVVGAPFKNIGGRAAQGSAYVFTRGFANGVALWTQQQQLVAEDGAANAFFGIAVAVSGDTVVVGASGANRNQGAAYVFTRSGTRWTLQKKLLADEDARDGHFGDALALSGDTVAVGAPTDAGGGQARQGAAYVFTRSGANWQKEQKLFAKDGAAVDEFGSSLALSGDTLAVGAPLKRLGVSGKQGAVYVFARENGVWAQQQKLSPNDDVFQGFGFSVALSGDTLAAGVLDDNSFTAGSQASVYVFTRSQTQPQTQLWTQQQKLITNDGGAHNFFSTSVTLGGDTLVAGAAFDGLGAQANQGAAYVFTRGGTGWALQRRLLASDGAAGDSFGNAVALSGDTVVVGANRDVIGSNKDQGSAYIFVCPPCPRLNFEPASLPDAQLGKGYNQLITVSFLGGDGMEALQFSLSDGALPLGLMLARNGQLTGTPTTTGTYRFTLTATFTSSLCPGSRSYTLTVSAPPGCDAQVSPVQQAFPAEGGSGAINVNVAPGCAWTAVSNDAWLTVTSGADGSGNGTVRFAVAKNPSAGSRRGTLAVAGRIVTVAQAAAMVCVSAASFAGNTLATESMVAAFGSGLANATEAAITQPLPTQLAGTRVSVRDSLGTERDASLFFVSPGQINFQIPPGTAVGKALVMVLRDSAIAATDSPQIELVSPGLFSANSSGQGLITGLALRVEADGSQSFEPVARFDEAQKRFVAVPINLDAASDRVFLVLFGTGLRYRASLGAVSIKIGGVNADALYAGPQGEFVGLDQLNVSLPRSLAGRGEVELSVMVEGREANNLKVAIK